MNVAIITARGGSKRLPRKNILPFCGHPLLAWSMKQAQVSEFIDLVVVTTDDQEIFGIANRYADEKTHVMLRPVWDDDTASNKSFYHAVKHIELLYKNKVGGDMGIDYIVSMFPTSPCRMPGDIDSMVTLAKTAKNILAWFSTPKETHIYEYCPSYDVSPVIRNKDSKYLHLASGTWCGKRDQMMDSWNQSFSDKELDEAMETDKKILYPYYVAPWQNIECDYKNDFKQAEMIMEHFILKGKGMKAYD